MEKRRGIINKRANLWYCTQEDIRGLVANQLARINEAWVRIPAIPPHQLYLKGLKEKKFYGNFKAVCPMAYLLQGVE